ncbi:programmed cell death 6-interacting protein-like [Sycon ciliatum]|uniref:programmed cell death 6-interacting protein-like n=1 Tax=Sycon ciliatum TaxID=27933 RepID=UPI0031F6CA8D
MDSMRKALFGSSRKEREPAPTTSNIVPAPAVAQPLQSAPPSYSAAQAYSAPTPYNSYGQHAAPYPGQQPVVAPRQAPGPPYAAQAPYPGHQQAHAQQHHAPYPQPGHPVQGHMAHGQPQQHQQHAPQPAPRRHHQQQNQAPPPTLPTALRSMRLSDPALERSKSVTGSLLDKIPVEVSRKYSTNSETVSFPVGFRAMERPDFNALMYDFTLEMSLIP